MPRTLLRRTTSVLGVIAIVALIGHARWGRAPNPPWSPTTPKWWPSPMRLRRIQASIADQADRASESALDRWRYRCVLPQAVDLPGSPR